MFPDLLLCIRLLIGLALVLAGFGLACVLVWAFLAATIKTWNVLLGRDRFSLNDAVNWFKRLPKWTRNGMDEQHAVWTINGFYDLLYLNRPNWWTDRREREEARKFLRNRSFIIKINDI